MKKIVIIGANDFQRPLIQKARERGYETHVFAWREGATGAEDADYFYEISITQKKEILEICREIRPDAVCTIGSDLANVTVQYLAEKLGLPGNSRSCIISSTNKFEMRKAFEAAGIPVPYFQVVKEGEDIEPPAYPVIVKPTDRSGSRAITRVEKKEELPAAIQAAVDQSFERRAIVEEYIPGGEYSVETISFGGQHLCLAITKKFTTGEPHYIEVGHLQPAPLSGKMQKQVQELIFAALDALQVRFGAAHSEVRIDEAGTVRIIEIGSRMGGDCIGSDLVPLSTGQDFVGMVLDTALGQPPRMSEVKNHVSAIRFLMDKRELEHLKRLQRCHPEAIRKVVIEGDVDTARIVDSGSRPGFYILQTENAKEMEYLLHEGPKENPIEAPGLARECISRMMEEHYDSLVINAGLHSDLSRILAETCVKLGLPCLVVGAWEEEERASENRAALKKLKVRELLGPWQDLEQNTRRAVKELEELGLRPYCFGERQ